MKLFAVCLFFTINVSASVGDILIADGESYYNTCRALTFRSMTTKAACLSASGNLISSAATALAFAYEVNPTDYIKHYELDTISAYDMYHKIMLYLTVRPYNKQAKLSTIVMDVLYVNYPIKWKGNV